MKSTLRFICAALVMVAHPALAAGGKEEPKQMDWAFEGVFGRFDKPAIQRGFQVYKEVCAACHSVKRVSFRQLGGIGFSEAEVKSLASSYTVKDGPDDAGDMFERPGRPSDIIPGPYANDNAARAANNGALPPDFSLLVKAREDGANYIYSLITGYGSEKPADMVLADGTHYNPYIDGHIIKMAMPIAGEGVTYQDGTAATIEQQAHDVVSFMQWAAEPEMEQRKSMGVHVMLFLGIMTIFFYLVKKRIWSNLH